MTVTVQWDTDAPITGQADSGTLSKTYTNAGAGTVAVTDEGAGGDSTTLNYTVPLTPTAVTADPAQVDSADGQADRTITVSGSGFGANTPGTVTLATGASGAYGTSVTVVSATTGPGGGFSDIAVTAPSDLDAGDYHIEAVFGSLGDLSTDVTVVNTELAAPTGLASPSQTATTADLTWDAVTAADQYVVRWSPAGEDNWTERAPVSATTDTVTGLTADTSYDFEVKSTATGATDSPWSSVLTQATPPQPQLATPTNLAPGTTTSSSVPLTWDAVANAGTYTVSWRPVGGSFTDIPDIASTSHEVTGLDPNSDYEFRVKASADGYLDSDWSTVQPATTASLGTLAAPTNLTSPAQGTTSVDLSWDAVTNADTYTTEWSPAGAGNWTSLTPASGTTSQVTGLTANTSYDFRITAHASGWTDSPPSSVLTQSTAT